MKKTSKLLLLLASLGMLVGCGPKGGDTTPPPETPNQINVIYFKSYVSSERAAAMKTAYVESLQTAGVEVDATKVNFFESTNSKVDGLIDEILRHNTKHPNNKIDVLLGANNFNKATDADQKAKFEAMYANDETDYTYGTSTNVEYNTNRKFWYNKDKLADQYVAGLQTYLKANWTASVEPEPVVTNKLVVMTYGVYVSADRMNAMKTAFNSYLTAQGKSITTVEFVHENTKTKIADFMGEVATYNTAHPDAKVDVLLGLKTNATITSAGFVNDGVDYNYGDRPSTASKDYTEDNKTRRFWYMPVTVEDSKVITAEEKLFQDYLLANWKTPEE